MNYFPKRWKHAHVSAIGKPGKDPPSLSSYRPISLLSNVGKILERVIASRLRKHTIENNVLPPEQFGFRAKRSTSHQLHRIICQARTNLQQGKSTGMLFFDIEKAFDRVWHQGLIYKLYKYKYPLYLIKNVASFLSERSFNVKIKSSLSDTKHIFWGVPQGAIMSPDLYNIYVSDPPKPPDCTTAFYADDTAIASSHIRFSPINNNLITASVQFLHYFTKWKILINTNKTTLLYITKRRTREIPDQSFIMDNTSIEWESKAKYLGVVLDKKLTLQPHIDYTMDKTQKCIRALYSLLNRKSSLSIRNKMLLFNTTLRPIFMYACPLYKNIARTHINKLQRLQNKILKMIHNLPWHTPTAELHELARTETVDEYLARLYDNFQESIDIDL